ncbi:MAG: PLDc N-terminal domain-containing protein [bacterium]
MKKIIGILATASLPMVSFAQNHGFRIMDCVGCNEFGHNNSILGVFFILLIPLIWIFLAVGAFVFWILMLVDAIKHSPEKMKIIWIIVIIFTHIIGALIYYFIEKRPRNKKQAVEK